MNRLLALRFLKRPGLCLLILCLLTSPATAFGYVWCVSADGHATLESALAGDCSLDQPAPCGEDNPGHALTVTAEDCGPCLDVSASHHWGNARHRQDDLPAQLLVNIALPAGEATVPLPEWSLNTPRVVDFFPRIPEPILYHRTTVLLI